MNVVQGVKTNKWGNACGDDADKRKSGSGTRIRCRTLSKPDRNEVDDSSILTYYNI